MGHSSKSHVEIRGAELNQAIQCMHQIDDALKTALSKGGALKSDIEVQGDWSGKNKKALVAYMDLLLQYQRRITQTVSKHAASLSSLEKHITAFSGTEEVAKIKGL
ncbi:hypothetical protein E4665_03340 [Sporolactobacillus shoreae]|uniref:WXG100 family type VII secretion target n=1 Tax=Sporolactobacillus shoreae TaxID=1465501 RepID=A0A4Z0GSV0_9BACL|nr:hypothetical protein [Sporolactobacillus shoreae]TGA99996.1 hypothetical protein E4665_03340 [Sporolactobacillus shoreae]